MIRVTYGYARVSKTDDATRNLETQLHILQKFGIREEQIFTDDMTGSSMSRPAWNELMTRVRPNDTVVVAWLDRFSRNFDEGVRIQAELTKPIPRWDVHFGGLEDDLKDSTALHLTFTSQLGATDSAV